MTLLSAADEVKLARRIEGGDLEAKQRMIESNLRLVHAVARSYRGGSVPSADLVQEGAIGLVRAVERFDHRRGVKFSTYAVWWIRRSMLDAIASANAIRMPVAQALQLVVILAITIAKHHDLTAEIEESLRGTQPDVDALLTHEPGHHSKHWCFQIF